MTGGFLSWISWGWWQGVGGDQSPSMTPMDIARADANQPTNRANVFGVNRADIGQPTNRHNVFSIDRAEG